MLRTPHRRTRQRGCQLLFTFLHCLSHSVIYIMECNLSALLITIVPGQGSVPGTLFSPHAEWTNEDVLNSPEDVSRNGV